MNKAFNFLIIAALLLGVACIFLITKYVDTKVKKASAAAPTKEWVMKDVLAAKEPITIGSGFTKFNTEIISVPEDFIVDGVLTNLDDLEGKIALHHIPVGDILMNAKAGAPKSLPKASAVIPKGKRLITIAVEDTNAAGFTVKNGDFVDLVGVFLVTPELLDREEMPIGETLSVTFLQKVEVFDIIHGQTSVPVDPENPDEEAAPGTGRLAQGTTATFVVSPQEAEIIMTAESVSEEMFMLLRRYDDEDLVPPPSPLHEKIAQMITGEGTEVKAAPAAPVVAPTAPPKKIVF